MSKLKLHYTPAVIVAIISGAISVAVSFGLHLTQANIHSILTLVGLILAGVVIGGGQKSRGMLDAGVHPIQKAAAADAARNGFGAFVVGRAEGDANEASGTTLTVSIEEPRADSPPRGAAALYWQPPAHGKDAHPVLQAHGTFKGLRLGKAEAKFDPRTPMLAEFMTASATLGRKLPKATHRLDPINAALGGDFGMMGNDTYGDCTCAGIGHAIQMWTGAHGAPATLTAGQILDLYWKTGSADDGRVMFDVLKYVHHNGLAGHQLGAYVAVGLRRYAHRDVKAAIDLFGGCYLGVALPETAQSQQVWDVTGDPTKPGPAQWGSWGGHAIQLVDYDHAGPTCITWGHPLKMTWAFLDAYADEAYAIISPDWLAGGKTIEGLDLTALDAYLEKIKHGYQPPM